jgi:hypothetical protein
MRVVNMSNCSHHSGDRFHKEPAMPSIRFRQFYRHHFLAEHRHPANVALHMAGTIAGAVFLIAALLSRWPWAMLLFPVVHAAPGLIGHRLFERNAAVGDVRVTRSDFPLWWFIAANHWLTFDVLLRRRTTPMQR